MIRRVRLLALLPILTACASTSTEGSVPEVKPRNFLRAINPGLNDAIFSTSLVALIVVLLATLVAIVLAVRYDWRLVSPRWDQSMLLGVAAVAFGLLALVLLTGMA